MKTNIDHIQSEVFGPLNPASTDILEGRCEISKSDISVMIQAEIENATRDQWLKTVTICEKIFMNLSEDIISSFRDVLGTRVTSAAFGPIGQEVGGDAKGLSEDLRLRKVMFFENGGCLFWASPNYIPDMELSLQFDLNFDVEEIIVW
ncbi:MAG: hypothetical protein ABJN69_08005 [Hellea sp.]